MGKFRQTNLRVMALDLRLKIAFCSFPLSNLSSFDRFSSNFAYELIPARSGLGL